MNPLFWHDKEILNILKPNLALYVTCSGLSSPTKSTFKSIDTIGPATSQYVYVCTRV